MAIKLSRGLIDYRWQLLCLLISCFSSLAAADLASAQSRLTYCAATKAEGFDPALFTSSATFDASSRQIYDRLVTYNRHNTQIIPALAKSYTISDDGLTYTFRLHAGVKFHTTSYFTPGRDLNASDVVFSIERQRAVEHPFHTVSGGTWDYFNGMSMPDIIESVKAVDDLTVQITLSRPYAPFIANMAMDFASVLSEEYALQLQASGATHLLNQQPIGTGPFKFLESEGETTKYLAHIDYWLEPAAIDELIFTAITDGNSRYEQFISGTCDVIGSLSSAEIENVQQQQDAYVIQQVGLNIAYLAYNTTVEPFDNVVVRRALNMAIDKAELIKSVYQGLGTVAKNPVPSTVWSYNHDILDDPYDPIQARALLASEGIKNLSMEIWAMPIVHAYNPNAQLMAELLKANFAEIGVNVTIVSHEWGEYLKLSKAIDRAGAVLMGWTGNNGDPDNFYSVLLGCDAVGNANRAQWCYNPFDNLIQQAKTATSSTVRQALYKSAQVVFKEQVPWATLAHSVVYKAVKDHVSGLAIDPFGGLHFHPAAVTRK